MISLVYSVWDSMAEYYSAPFLVKSKGEALRSFIEALADDKSTVGKYPDCFSLYELGKYDDSTASYILHKEPVLIGKGNELRTQAQKTLSPLGDEC